MRQKIFLAFIVSLLISITIHAQSIFHLKYHFTNTVKAVSREAFLVRFNNGTGFYRVSFYDEAAKRNIITEFQTEEHFEVNKDGSVNTNKLYLKGLNPKIIDGTKNSPYTSETFSFQKDLKTYVTISLNKDLKNKIPKRVETVFAIYTTGLMGQKYINITIPDAKPNEVYFADGDEWVGIDPPSIDQMMMAFSSWFDGKNGGQVLAEIMKETETFLANLNGIVNENRGDKIGRAHV